MIETRLDRCECRIEAVTPFYYEKAKSNLQNPNKRRPMNDL